VSGKQTEVVILSHTGCSPLSIFSGPRDFPDQGIVLLSRIMRNYEDRGEASLLYFASTLAVKLVLLCFLALILEWWMVTLNLSKLG